jgi:hypothetical protein
MGQPVTKNDDPAMIIQWLVKRQMIVSVNKVIKFRMLLQDFS